MGHGKRFIAKVESDNNDYTTSGYLGSDNVLSGTRQNGTWTANLSSLAGGGGGASGSVKASALYSIPFYSGSAYGDIVSGASGFSYYQGNVGVNLNINPTYPLHVSQSSGDTYGMYLVNSAGRGLRFGDTSANGTGYGKIEGLGGSLFLGSTQVYTSFLGTGDANTTLGSSGRRWSYFYTRYGAFGYKTSVTEGTDYVVAISSSTTKHPMIVRDSQYGTPLVITSGGNVGIGELSPAEKLQVKGNIRIDDGTNDNRLIFNNHSTVFTSDSNDSSMQMRSYGGNKYNYPIKWVGASGASNYHNISFHDDFVMISGNKMGIGTTTPDKPFVIRTGGSRDFKFYDYDMTYESSLGIRAKNNGYLGLVTEGDNSVFISTNGFANKRLVVNSAGKVGIGTTGPNEKLHVVGNISASSSTPANAIFKSNGNNALYHDANTAWIYGAATDLQFVDYSTGHTSMTIKSKKVGIGTTSPETTLNVSGHALIGSGASSYLDKLYIGNTTKGIYGYNNRLDFYLTSNPRAHIDASSFYSATNFGPKLDLTPGPLGTANYGFVGDENTGMSRGASDKLHLLTAGVSGVTVVPAYSSSLSQNVGIGTTSPSYLLDLYSSGTSHAVRFKNASTNGYVMRLDAGGDNSNIQFQTDHIIASQALHMMNDNANMYLRTAGHKVGIGTSSPKTEMTLNGALSFLSGSVTSADAYRSLWASGSNLYWGTTQIDSTGGGTISGTVAANQVAYGTYSDTLGGSSNLTFDGTRFSSHVRIADDKKLLLGNSSDLQLYHSAGASSYFTNGTNALIIWNQDSDGGTLKLRNDREDYGIQFDVSGTEVGRFTRVGGAGRLGLGGVTAPNSTLDVGGNARIRSTNKLYFGDSATTEYIYADGSDIRIHASDNLLLDPADDIVIRADDIAIEANGGGSEWARFNGGLESFGIGTTTPSEKIHVIGNTLVSGSSYIQGADASYTKWNQTVNSSGKWQLIQGSTQRVIGSSGEFQFANDVIVDNDLIVNNSAAVGSARATILDTSNPQLNLVYDGSNYNSFRTKDDGALEIKRNGTAATDRIALLSGTNILIGQYAGYDINSSQTGESVLIGDRAGFELKGNEPHGRHTIIGAQAVYTMSGTTDSDYITAIGAYCAYGAKHSKGFTAIGPFAGYYLSGSGDGPLLLGNGAGKGTAFGAWGTTNGVTMNEDVLIGNGGVAEYAETLSQNTIVGSRAAGFMRVGTQNVAVGRFAMRNASGTQGTTGNVAIGQSAGAGIGQDNDGSSASSYNIAIGYETQEKSLAGDRNIAIGYKVGIDGDSAVDDILRIGNAAGDYSFIRGDMANNNLWIGAGTPKFVITGNNVGVGTTTPGFPFVVSGSQYDMARIGSTHSAGTALYLDAKATGGSLWHLQSTATGAGTGGGKLDFVDAGTSRMVIDSAGKVGIGTTGPNYELDVSSTDPQIALTDTNGVTYYFMSQSNDFYLHDATAGATRLFIKDGGNVGINTTSPSDLLTVAGDTNASTQIGAYAYSATDDKTAKIFLNKSANSTAGSHTAVANGDYLGLLAFRGSDGDSFEIGAQIRGQATQDFGAAARGADLIFSTVDNSTTALDDRMVITQAGNVGIGTTGPDDLLHVLGGDVDPSIKLQNNRSGHNGYYLMEHRGSTLKLQSTGSSTVPMRFTIQNTDMMRLDATGLGIGTSAPTTKLDVHGTTLLSGTTNVVGDLGVSSDLIVTGSTLSVQKTIKNDIAGTHTISDSYGHYLATADNAGSATCTITAPSSPSIGDEYFIVARCVYLAAAPGSALVRITPNTGQTINAEVNAGSYIALNTLSSGAGAAGGPLMTYRTAHLICVEGDTWSLTLSDVGPTS